MTLAERERMLATVAATFRRCAAETGLAAPDPRVVDVMRTVPRERFVPPDLARRAHDDCALSIACGQTISQPFVVALMSTLLRPEPWHRVLEVGTGSGYQAAVLGQLVGEVHTVELVPQLAATATSTLRDLGCHNVNVHHGDGFAGWPPSAPYDGILVACGATSIPPALLQQLAPGAHLVIPIGPRGDQRLLDVTVDANGHPMHRDVLGVRFVPFVH